MNAQDFGLDPEQAQVFEGLHAAIMPQLIDAGFIPWSIADVMDNRSQVLHEHKIWNNYVDSDFGIAGTKKNVYLDPHSSRLRAVTPKTGTRLPLAANDLPHGVQVYDRNDLILDRSLTEEEARRSPAWLSFADGDLQRLDTFVEKTFRFGKDVYAYDVMMGIYVPEDKEPILRAVVINGLCNGSGAYGVNDLGYNSRLVGVRSGTSAASPKGAVPERARDELLQVTGATRDSTALQPKL